jgi:ATP-dependent DNA helicase RecG
LRPQKSLKKMSEQELRKILSDAVSLPAETEIVEFKEAKNGYDFDKIGEYFSALSNEANLKGKSCAWLIFGVENKKHQIVGSQFRANRKDLDSLKKEICDKTTQNISFIEIHELPTPEGRVVMFQIPAAPQGIPVAFEGFYYGRANESLVALNIEKIERIRNQAIGKDWSKNIIPDATIGDLDKEAILKARELFKEKKPRLEKEVDTWNDVTFLNKAKVTIDGMITNTAILLLGKNESTHFISPAIAQITWILKDDPSDYEHFHTPFILTVEQALSKIRNLKYRHLGFGTLFPDEVYKYDEWVIREALHNSVAHQDYGRSGRIHLLEYKNKLVFENVGGFIPDSVEEAIKFDSPQHYYRNPFLAEAMVNLNMIDTIGSGIKKMFTKQKERFFPMPDYDISDEIRTRVTVLGEIINDNYAHQLKTRPELSLEDVIALDKVQKKQAITDEEVNRLRELKLIAGWLPDIQIIAEERPKNIPYSEYRNMILKYLEEKGSSPREDIEKLIMPTLPFDMPMDKKQKKISNILVKMSSKDLLIKNISRSPKYPVWELRKDND